MVGRPLVYALGDASFTHVCRKDTLHQRRGLHHRSGVLAFAPIGPTWTATANLSQQNPGPGDAGTDGGMVDTGAKDAPLDAADTRNQPDRAGTTVDSIAVCGN